MLWMSVPPKPGGSGRLVIYFLSLVQGVTLTYFQNSQKPSQQDSFS